MNVDGPAASNVATLFEQAAARRGSAPAIVAPDGRVLWTFEALAEAAGRSAAGLVSAGLEPGDRVLVLETERRAQLLAVASAIWAGGAVVAPPAGGSFRQALRTVSATRPKVVIVGFGFVPVVAAVPALRRAPIRVINGRRRLPGLMTSHELARRQPMAPRAIDPDLPALISWTTGSTAAAKVVVRSHRVLGAQHRAIGVLRGLNDADRDLAGLSTLILDNLARGVTSVLAPSRPGSRAYGRAFRDALIQGRATTAVGFPQQFVALVRASDRGALSAVRAIHVGGDRVSGGLVRDLAELAPSAVATVVYGSTEVEPISALDAPTYMELLRARGGRGGICVGLPIEGLDLSIGQSPDAPGAEEGVATGPILLRGDRVSGWGGSTGWLDTGDTGWIDNEGRLWLLGRTVNVSGGWSPATIEGALESLPWVESAAAVRRTDRGEGLALAVQPRDWSTRTVRAGQLAAVQALAHQRGWPAATIMLVRAMPRLGGAAAKIDAERIRMIARRRTTRAGKVRVQP